MVGIVGAVSQVQSYRGSATGSYIMFAARQVARTRTAAFSRTISVGLDRTTSSGIAYAITVAESGAACSLLGVETARRL